MVPEGLTRALKRVPAARVPLGWLLCATPRAAFSVPAPAAQTLVSHSPLLGLQFPELLAVSYNANVDNPHDADGLVLVWNSHVPTRPEYEFQCQVR